jgi:hypothetical protein
VVALFSATLLLSAALVFLVQPLFAKEVLPLFGSTPAVWNTSLVFFQTALLLAYLYAHATTRWLGVRRQAALHVVIVLVALVALPIAVPGDFRPPAEGDAVLSLLGLLTVAVGLPYFVVAATAPLLQRWLAGSRHRAASDPYFLYRASNVGSVIGLLGYPLALEPSLRLDAQGWVWAGGYAALAVLLVLCAVAVWRGAPADDHPDVARAEPPPAIPRARRGRWVLLAAVPSSLMLGVTAFLTIDIAPVPLLWALPLTLYLASFVVAFSPTPRAERVHRAAVFALPGVAIALLVLLLVGAREPLWLVMPLHLLGFFALAVACHSELARDRPPASGLTGFYLLVAVGGALGGIVTGILIPALVDALPEYPLALVLACACLPARPPRVPASRYVRWLDVGLPLVIGLLVAGALAVVALDPSRQFEGAGKTFAIGLGAGIALNLVRRPWRFALAIGAIALAGSLRIGDREDVLLRERSFFGMYTVNAIPSGARHELVHGTTVHGVQDVRPGRRTTPLAYFSREGPIGQVMAAVPPDLRRHVGIIGLGTGTLACYGRPGDAYTFYELDPTVERIARDPSLFTYLRGCRPRIGVVPGDARLSLVHAPARGYGVFVADAFSADAIPTHLMTRQAFRLYRAKMRPDGVLAFHVSNRFLDLEPVLGDLARDAGMTCVSDDETAPGRKVDLPPGATRSHWLAMSAAPASLAGVRGHGAWRPCRRAGSAVWTDDFSSPVGALKLG